MKGFSGNLQHRLIKPTIIALLVSTLAFPLGFYGGYAFSDPIPAPAPVLTKGGKPVEWWFVFKFNTHSFQGCASGAERSCPFGGEVQDYGGHYGQQFVYASSDDVSLKSGAGCLGDSDTDPLGSTFDEVYNGNFNYVIWNDQFYGDPMANSSSNSGHSKGMLVWDDTGAGFVMQVSTPSWPASGSKAFPRKTDGNTLGCIADDNVEVSQHFFALRLTKDDVIAVLEALHNASVVTDPENLQIVHNGGPEEIRQLVDQLSEKTKSKTYTVVTLSSGVGLISKPPGLHVPPWQLVSATLNGVPLRVATWWTNPNRIPSTDARADIACWDSSLGAPGPVENAASGHWGNQTFSLTGGASPDHNHAKFGVSTDADSGYAIFGDLNQQGALSGNCRSSQNARGGVFYVIQNKDLQRSIANLIH